MAITYDTDQIKAIEFDKGLAVVTAGAGSGKTRAIIGRIDYLVSQRGVSAERILAVTFTNAAADEMKERLSGDAKNVRAATIHSEALAVTRKYLDKRFNAKRFGGSVLSDKDSRQLITYIIQAPSRFNPLGANLIEDYPEWDIQIKNVKGYVSRISRLKDELCTAEAYAKRSDADPALAEIYRLYEDAKAKGYRHPQTKLSGQVTVDFGDMLMIAVKAFRERPDILAEWQAKYDYVMVDESQDCNMAQYAFIRMIAAKHGNLMYVGDDWQSIYRFRGAAPMEFIKAAEDATIIPMGTNYRSRRAIVELGERLIAHNPDQLSKQVKAVRE